MPLTPLPPKNSHLIYSFFSLVDIFFAEKNVPTMLFSTGHFSFYFSFPIANRIFFLPILTFRSFWSCENHDFFLKEIETCYKFLIVILRYIIRILVFPLDDIFVFDDIFFS